MRHPGCGAVVLPMVFLVLGACAGRTHPTQPPAVEVRNATPAVSEQSTPLRQPDSPYRTVVHGDTLYSIAWEAGQDYRRLAAWNHITPPYTIQPGQVLRILPPAVEKSVPTSAKSTPIKAKEKNKAAVVPKTTNKQPKRVTPLPPAKPVATGTPAKKTKNEARDKARVATSKPSVATKSTPMAGTWMWPAEGQLLKRYSGIDAAKGLDIGGTRGQPIHAAASGRVVYQGSGLRGYGQLIIIKHSDEYLSAYAHNDRIYVKEGAVVKRGQKIADMGSTGTDRVKLHFEIRRQGAPIDPLKFLPKR